MAAYYGTFLSLGGPSSHGYFPYEKSPTNSRNDWSLIKSARIRVSGTDFFSQQATLIGLDHLFIA